MKKFSIKVNDRNFIVFANSREEAAFKLRDALPQDDIHAEAAGLMDATDIQKLASNFGGKSVPGEVYITYRFPARRGADDFASELLRRGEKFSRNSNGDVILREKNKEYRDAAGKVLEPLVEVEHLNDGYRWPFSGKLTVEETLKKYNIDKNNDYWDIYLESKNTVAPFSERKRYLGSKCYDIYNHKGVPHLTVKDSSITDLDKGYKAYRVSGSKDDGRFLTSVPAVVVANSDNEAVTKYLQHYPDYREKIKVVPASDRDIELAKKMHKFYDAEIKDGISFFTTYKNHRIWKDNSDGQLYLAISNSGKKLQRIGTDNLSEAKKKLDEMDSFLIEDDRLAPMTYKKLKEFGYTSDDWGDWTQEQANEVVRKHSEGQGEQAKRGSEKEVSESEEVVEETGKGKRVSESEGGDYSNKPQENKKQKAPKSTPGNNDKKWLSAFGKEEGNWQTRAKGDEKVTGEFSSSVWEDGVPVLKRWDRGQTETREIEIKKGTPIVVDRDGYAWIQTDNGWLMTSQTSGIVNKNSSVTLSGSNEISPERAEEIAEEFGLEVVSDENGNKFVGERDRILEMIDGSFGWPKSDDIKEGVQEEGAEEYEEDDEEEETDFGYEREEAVKRFEESEEGDIVEFPNGESAVLVRKEGEGAFVKPYPYGGDEYFVHAFDF